MTNKQNEVRRKNSYNKELWRATEKGNILNNNSKDRDSNSLVLFPPNKT